MHNILVELLSSGSRLNAMAVYSIVSICGICTNDIDTWLCFVQTINSPLIVFIFNEFFVQFVSGE